MTDVLLLESPDGNRYKATLCLGQIWYVMPFFQQYRTFDYQKNYCGEYTTKNLKETFSILAATETDMHICWEPIHDAYA